METYLLNALQARIKGIERALDIIPNEYSRGRLEAFQEVINMVEFYQEEYDKANKRKDESI